ncbi:MAG: potassium channel family protein [Bacilli bacterium]|nr:potassium channel family protein [Bacilli bacterium]
MKKNIYPIIEMVLAAILIAVGLVTIINIELIVGFLFWIIIGFFAFKVLIVLLRQLSIDSSKIYVLAQAILSSIAITAIVIFKENKELLAYVIIFSAGIDFVTNIIKAIGFRKKGDTEEFFGMDNVVCILFVVLSIVNINSPHIATAVLFGSLVLYEGVSPAVSNRVFRSIVSKSSLGKAVNKVHGLDILFGLIIIVTLSSFIIPYIEPGITTVGDAWWYCFALITTIGFGDFTAVTITGRILSVIIGFYGIIIVSLLTSSIVVYITDESEKKNKKK